MPIISSPVSAREAFYDRNPVFVGRVAEAVVSENTGSTQAFTYTVPSGKSAFLTSAQAYLMQQAEASTTAADDEAIVDIGVTPNGGGANAVLRVFFNSDVTSRGTFNHAELSGGLVMLAGDQIKGDRYYAGTASGAGRIRMGQSITAIEFDA